MATGSTSKVSRQSHLFLALLILLWGLVLCFVGYQYSREKSQVIGLLSSRLQLLNMQMGDDIEAGVPSSDFYDRNSDRFDELEITVFSCEDCVSYNSNGVDMLQEKLGVINEAKEQNVDIVIRPSLEDENREYIHSISNIGEYTICSSCSYSLSFFDIFSGSNTFLIVAVAISILISIIGFITSKLYYNLDITTKERDREHETARREERDKVRLKRQLTNNINHELKTPICSILGYMEMILNNENLTPEQTRQFVTKSYDQAERLRHLMMDLSTITRIDEASSMIERERINLATLIQDVQDDVVPQLEKQNITIKSNITKDLYIDGNHSLLYSIFRNLVDNAIAYSGGRNIWIDLIAEDNKKYYFSLRDNGIGIEEKHLQYIFERFYRVDKGRSRKMGGTGLGLSIVKNAILFHSGSIEARLEEMGGLEFRFSLGDKSYPAPKKS
ncbi:MAG: ATP-binding protein [Rikenellaceae bacterium]